MSGKMMMDTYDQHRNYRLCNKGGSVYLAVEGVLWLSSATFGAIGQIPVAMLLLMVGGMLIHPIAALVSKLLRLPTPNPSNRLSSLNTWIALTIPLGIPLIFMATAGGHENHFFPAFAVLVGAHWLPFTYLYAMKSFVFLAGMMVLVGILFGFEYTQSFSASGFLIGGILLLFAATHLVIVRHETQRDSDGTRD
ncbi:hypothetical protein KQI63_08775 [bacterium]|nr:hypothetical protein [bacterium]